MICCGHPPVTVGFFWRNAMEFQVGQRIGGRFEVHRIYGGAGRSGMGVVYVCHDLKKGGVLALKTHQEGFFRDKTLKDAFKRGALAWIHLDRHPYVVRAHGVFNLADRLYLALEYIAPDARGRNNLSHHFAAPVPLQRAVGWALQFCDAMEHARRKGITPHRDIKPDNLMVTAQGQLKVTDFDLAGLGLGAGDRDRVQAAAGASSPSRPGPTFIQHTNENAMAGTLPWMAPEQFDGVTDTRSDIYSFGLVLYQMAALGKLPFAPENKDWKTAHQTLSPQPLDTSLWPVIRTCLMKNPDQRFGSGDPSKAFVSLRQALAYIWEKKWPNKPLPAPPKWDVLKYTDLNDKGVSFAALGLYKQAVEQYKKALALNPGYAPAYHNIGAALASLGRKEQAAKAYVKAAKLDPSMGEAYNNYGLILKESGQLAQAEKAFKKAVAVSPDLSKAYENLGILLSENGRNQEALDLLGKAVQKDPYNPGHQYSLGVCLEMSGQYPRALESYLKAVEMNPDNAAHVYGLGNGYRHLGDMERAVECWQKAARLDPGHCLARFNLGIAFDRAGRKPEALQWYEAAMGADPTNANPYYNYALLMAQEKLYGKAADGFENFVKYAGPDLAPHVDKARGYVPDLRLDEEHYRKLMETEPTAIYNRALSLLNLGKLDDARPLFDRALAMRPGYALALCGLGIWHERKGDFAAAADCYGRSLKADPAYVVAWNNLGWASFNLGDLHAAETAYEKFLAKAPPDQTAWIQSAEQVLAEIKARLGKLG